MITLGSVNFVPQPSINIMPEFFYYGKEVVGGYLVLELKGTHHAADYNDFNDMQETLLGMQDTCQSLSVSNPAICTSNILTGTKTIKLNGTNARVTEVRVSVGSSELDLNYTITLECSKDNSKLPFITNTTNLPFEDHIGNKAIVQSYSEKVTATYNNVNKFIVEIGQGNKVDLIKSHATFNIDLKLSLFYNDMCDSNNIDYAKEIEDFLYARMQDIIDNPDKVGINPYPKNTYQVLGTNVKTGWDAPYSQSLTFQLYLLPISSSQPKALVDLSETEETNQTTGAVSLKVKGSVVGLDSSKSARSPNHDANSNASLAYNRIKNYYVNPDKGYFLITDCSPIPGATTTTTTPAPAPPGEPPDAPGGEPQERQSPGGMCYELVNSSVSYLSSSNRIDFDLTYQDAELCSLLGYKLSTQYEERPSVTGRAEHFSPGRPYSYGPLTYYSNASSAPKYKITVQGELPSSCLQHSVGADNLPTGVGELFVDSLNLSNKVTELKNAVDDEFNLQKIKWKLTTANNIMPGKGQTNTSRYKYSITQEFIKCQ